MNIEFKMELKPKYISGLLSLGIMLTGCSGSDDANTASVKYDGLTSAITLDSNNQSILSDSTINLSLGFISASTIDIADIPTPFDDHLVSTADCENSSISGTGDTRTYTDFCINNAVANGTVKTSLLNVSSLATYSNFSLMYGANEFILNGTVEDKRVGDSSRSRVLSFVVMNDDEETSFYANEMCSIDTNGSDLLSVGNCTLDKLVDYNDAVFKIEKLTASKNLNQAWDIEGKVFYPEHGYLSYEANDLVVCEQDASRFESGSIVLEDDLDNVLAINLSNCIDDPVEVLTLAIVE